MIGAAEALRQYSGAVRPLSDQRWYTALVQHLMTGEQDALRSAWSSGQASPLTELLVESGVAKSTLDAD